VPKPPPPPPPRKGRGGGKARGHAPFEQVLEGARRGAGPRTGRRKEAEPRCIKMGVCENAVVGRLVRGEREFRSFVVLRLKGSSFDGRGCFWSVVRGVFVRGVSFERVFHSFVVLRLKGSSFDGRGCFWSFVRRGAFRVWSRARSLVVRRRQSAGVGVGALGCGSVCAEETRAARTRGSPRNAGKSPFLISFSFGFLCVCVS